MNGSNLINEKTAVNGLFGNVEVIFTLADCKRVPDCIKVNIKVRTENNPADICISNAQKIDEDHLGEVPKTLCLSDSRLVLTDVSKGQIRNYFNVDTPTQKPVTKKVTKINNSNVAKRADYAVHHN